MANFSDIIPDPPIDKIAAGIKQLAAFQGDTILALGGDPLLMRPKQ